MFFFTIAAQNRIRNLTLSSGFTALPTNPFNRAFSGGLASNRAFNGGVVSQAFDLIRTGGNLAMSFGVTAIVAGLKFIWYGLFVALAGIVGSAVIGAASSRPAIAA